NGIERRITMQPGSSQPRRLWLSIGLVALIAITASARARKHQAAPSASLACNSEQRMWERADRLCRRLEPLASDLRLTAATSDHQLNVPLWIVSCADMAGRNLAVFHWHGQTGDLMFVSHTVPNSFPRPQRLLSAAEALRAARRWLNALELGGPSER